MYEKKTDAVLSFCDPLNPSVAALAAHKSSADRECELAEPSNVLS